MSWKHYAYAMLVVNFLGLIVVYGLLRLQDFLPLNPQSMAGDARPTWRSTRPSALPPTPTGRATAAKRR